MTKREFWILSLATICGFIAGRVANWQQPVKAASDIIRASRFELIDESGRAIGFWGRNQAGNTVLAFTGKNTNELAAMGIRSDTRPFLDMAGSDGKVRLTLRLETGDKALLGMGDEKWEGRVLLGSIEHDAKTPGDDWGLLFRAPGPVSELASIGVVSDSKGRRSGVLTLRHSTGESWSAPKQ